MAADKSRREESGTAIEVGSVRASLNRNPIGQGTRCGSHLVIAPESTSPFLNRSSKAASRDEPEMADAAPSNQGQGNA
jgi:hypothetical protein